jgi:hypothetical protein
VTNEEYGKAAQVTDIADYLPVVERVSNYRTIQILHALMGITTECGEMMDNLKKHLIYGKPLDMVNFKEEDGDLRWYLAKLEYAVGYSADEAQEANIAKLKARFPNRFNEIDALQRDLDRERLILEGFQKPLTKKWDKQIGAWKFSCGCIQFQDGYELCDKHKPGGYKALLADWDIDKSIQKRTSEAAE